MALAQASGALEDAVEYVQERKQFGKPIVDFQAVQLKLAEMAMQVEAARLLIYRAACNAEAGMPDYERPAGVPREFARHTELMFDLMTLAMQTDSTSLRTAPTDRIQKSRRMSPKASRSSLPTGAATLVAHPPANAPRTRPMQTWTPHPGVMKAFWGLHKAAIATGALDTKTKELITLAISVATRCDDCIAHHTYDALEAGATKEEIADALGVAILMGGGTSVVYATHAVEALEHFAERAS